MTDFTNTILNFKCYIGAEATLAKKEKNLPDRLLRRIMSDKFFSHELRSTRSYFAPARDYRRLTKQFIFQTLASQPRSI